jgi:hypothetical protein
MRAQTHTNSLLIESFNTPSIFKCIISSFSVNLTYVNNITTSTKMSNSNSSSSLTNRLTPELSPPWEAASCSFTQEIINSLCDPKVHYCVHKSPPLVPILSQMNPVYIIPTYSLSSILWLGTPNGLSPSGFPTETLWLDHSDYIAYIPQPAQFSSHSHNLSP